MNIFPDDIIIFGRSVLGCSESYVVAEVKPIKYGRTSIKVYCPGPLLIRLGLDLVLLEDSIEGTLVDYLGKPYYRRFEEPIRVLNVIAGEPALSAGSEVAAEASRAEAVLDQRIHEGFQAVEGDPSRVRRKIKDKRGHVDDHHST